MAPGHRTQLDLQDASQKQQDKGKLGLEFGKLGLAWDSAMQLCEFEKKNYIWLNLVLSHIESRVNC